MAWIESHQDLRNHPKVARLRRLLDIDLPRAVGTLHLLWWWALDHAEDGDLREYDALDIADACCWDGDPDALLKALVDCGPGERCGFVGVIDGHYELHDWDIYAGRLIEARRHHAAQKRKHRELYNDTELTEAIRRRDGDHCRYCARLVNWKDRRGATGATYDYVDPWGPTDLENIVVACRACNAGKSQRTPEEAGYRLLPADHWQVKADTNPRSDHDLHQQDLTEPDRTTEETPSPPAEPSVSLERRSDVDGLCDLLADLVEGNDCRRPTITAKWRTEARLLLDRDAVDLATAERVLRWALADPFWRSNVLSIPTFRKQFDRLRLASERTTTTGRAPTPHERSQANLAKVAEQIGVSR